MAQVFDGITVLDFTSGMPGGIATMVMSDFGAEVIKVVPPEGEKFADAPGALQWNRGKKSVALDLKSPQGREQVQRLARLADVVVESFRPGVTERLGIDYERLSAGHPALVYASLTGFGTQGPYANYKGYDAVVAAKSGRMMMFAQQNPREGPNYVVVQGACHSAATALIRGITAALYMREHTGRGQKVETSLLKTITTYDHVSWIHAQMIEKHPEIHPPDPTAGIGRPNPTGYLPARTKDGRWIQLGNIVERLFRSMMQALDMTFVYDDPRYRHAPSVDEEDVPELERMMLERFGEKTFEQWMEQFVGEAGDVAAEPYMTSEEALDHPQMVYNGHVLDIGDPRVGATRQLGPMVLMQQTPGHPKGPAPEPGQHTAEVLARLNGRDRKTVNGGAGPMPGSPLEGITLPGSRHGHQRAARLRAGGRARRQGDPDRSPRRGLDEAGPSRPVGAAHDGRLRRGVLEFEDTRRPGDRTAAGGQGGSPASQHASRRARADRYRLRAARGAETPTLSTSTPAAMAPAAPIPTARQWRRSPARCAAAPWRRWGETASRLRIGKFPSTRPQKSPASSSEPTTAPPTTTPRWSTRWV